MTESKSLAYNRNLYTQFIMRSKVFSRYPKVSEQIECLPLQTDKLFAFGYNPTFNDKGWLVYRFHKGSPATKLAIAQIDDQGAVFSNRELVIGPHSEEDAKLFTIQGEDYLSWVDSLWPVQFKSSVKCAKFKDGQFSEFKQPDIGKNDGTATEKNWVFFEYEGRMHVIHQCHPNHQVYNLTKPGLVYDSAPPIWPYGAIKGGTQPLPYEGKWLRFIHGRLDNEQGPVIHRYRVGAYLMNPEPPFNVVAVSKKPIIHGSEVDSLTPEQRKKVPHRKMNVVFPSGAVQKDDGWIVSIGENDCACKLVKIRPKDLNF